MVISNLVAGICVNSEQATSVILSFKFLECTSAAASFPNSYLFTVHKIHVGYVLLQTGVDIDGVSEK